MVPPTPCAPSIRPPDAPSPDPPVPAARPAGTTIAEHRIDVRWAPSRPLPPAVPRAPPPPPPGPRCCSAAGAKPLYSAARARAAHVRGRQTAPPPRARAPLPQRRPSATAPTPARRTPHRHRRPRTPGAARLGSPGEGDPREWRAGSVAPPPPPHLAPPAASVSTHVPPPPRIAVPRRHRRPAPAGTPYAGRLHAPRTPRALRGPAPGRSRRLPPANGSPPRGGNVQRRRNVNTHLAPLPPPPPEGGAGPPCQRARPPPVSAPRPSAVSPEPPHRAGVIPIRSLRVLRRQSLPPALRGLR